MSGEYSGREVMRTEALGWGLVYSEQQGGRCGRSLERQADRATVGHLEDSGFILTVMETTGGLRGRQDRAWFTFSRKPPWLPTWGQWPSWVPTERPLPPQVSLLSKVFLRLLPTCVPSRARAVPHSPSPPPRPVPCSKCIRRTNR